MDKTYWITVAVCSVWLLGYWIGYYHSHNSVTIYKSVVHYYNTKENYGDVRLPFTHDERYDNRDYLATRVKIARDNHNEKVNMEYTKEMIQHHDSEVNNIRSRIVLDGLVTIVHNQDVFKIRRDYNRIFKLMPPKIVPDAYVLQTDKLPDNVKFYPSVANGHLGTVIHSSKVFMNGVYNGATIETHRAAIPSTCSVVVNHTNSAAASNRTYQLNIGEGVYSEQLKSEAYIITQRLYAHRTQNRLIIVEIEVVKKSDVALNVTLELNKWNISDDITFVRQESGINGVNYQHGTTNIPERNDSSPTEVHVYYDSIPDFLLLPQGENSKTWVFLTSISVTKGDAESFYLKGQEMLKSGSLYLSHVEAWADIWSSGLIYAEGNLNLSRTVLAGYYYILSSVPREEDPVWPYVGISPTGLPTGDVEEDYRGHVFWDQDTWQYPPILFVHSDFAESMITNRKRIVTAAKKQSEAYGFKGLKFPWEAALTGYEVSPSSDCQDYEIHINGDISQSIAQYFHMTNNTDLLPEYADIVTGIADFWVSRMVYNDTMKKYEIKHVLPADEDAGPVDNNVYTSVIAGVSIENAEYVSQQLGRATEQWKGYKDNIYVPFDDYLQFHPEYDGYPFIGTGITVKQADVVLMGYPLNRNLSSTVKKNDISFYSQVTKDGGPAMTWSIISISWLDLGQIDQGHSYFERNFGNVHGDFKVWLETTEGWGAANFLTGIGGFLQNIIAGYGGFRLYPDRLTFNPSLPRNTTELYFRGIDYLGSHLDFTVSTNKTTIELVKVPENKSSPVTLCVYCESIGKEYLLKLNSVISLPRARGVIMPSRMCHMES